MKQILIQSPKDKYKIERLVLYPNELKEMYKTCGIENDKIMIVEVDDSILTSVTVMTPQ